MNKPYWFWKVECGISQHFLVFNTRYGLGLMLDDNTMKNIVCSHRSIKSCFDPSKHFYETTEIKLYIFLLNALSPWATWSLVLVKVRNGPSTEHARMLARSNHFLGCSERSILELLEIEHARARSVLELWCSMLARCSKAKKNHSQYIWN